MQNNDNDRAERSWRPNEPDALIDDSVLLNNPLPSELGPSAMEQTWAEYQAVIGKLLIRMGMENPLLDSIARVALVGTFEGFYARMALIPKLSSSAFHALRNHGAGEMLYRLGGECSLMELSAAAGYRTFCFPDLIRGLLKTGKMKDRSVDRMMDTFEFLNTMVKYPLSDDRVLQQLERTNRLHAKYKVAGAHSSAARDLFKYIALNMFYIGPSMRPDLTPQERHAICGLTVLVSAKMGHRIEGSVNELEKFIRDFEGSQMFSLQDTSVLRQRAIDIAQASRIGLHRVPTISPARIHGYVPYRVKQILQLS
jgi:hypothetical protein